MWLRSGGTSEMQFLVRATSRDRGWTGLEATLYDTSGGLVAIPKMARHNLSMHVGSPVIATCRCEGPIDRRLQSPGDIDFVPVGCSAVWEDSGPTTFLSIALEHSLMRETAEVMGLNPDALAFEPELQIKDPRLEHIGWALKAELETRDSGGRLYAEGLGTALAAQLLRRFGRLSYGVSERGLTRRQRRAVTDYIEHHIAADLSLRELADVAGVSASHFRSLFKETMGMPPHQYVIQRRVRHATRMLARGAARLSDVALRTGFADQSHMARCMRRLTGMTPSTVLRQCK